MTDLDKLTQDQLETLPPPLQQAIKTISWKESIIGIGESNGLDATKINTLEAETLLIIYCFEPEEKFKENLLRELQIDEKVIVVIIKEIQEEIFSPILEMADSLESLHVPKSELELEASKEEVLIPEHTEVNPPAFIVEPEKEPKNINLLEEKPIEVEKPKIFEPTVQETAVPSKNIVEEHLSQPVTSTSKYTGGIDPYREPLV